MNKKLMAFALAAVLVLGSAVVYLTQSVNEVLVPLQIQKDETGVPSALVVTPSLTQTLKNSQWIPLLVRGARGEGLKAEVLEGPDGWPGVLFSMPDYEGFAPLPEQTYLMLVEPTEDIKDRWEGRFRVFALHAVNAEHWEQVVTLTKHLEHLPLSSHNTPAEPE